jgi:hypothetical protein
MFELELARGNSTATSIVIQRFNITPELAYLLQESFDVTGPGGVGGEVILLPKRITQIRELNKDIVTITVYVLLRPELINKDEADTLAYLLQDGLNLTDSEGDEIYYLLRGKT